MEEREIITKATTFLIGVEQLDEIKKFALDHNMSMAELLRRAVDEYVEVHKVQVEGGEN